tara:strand:- start:2 stop:526 length:525 start_codon:yes stop_codon:yes gene_type:complete
MNIGQGVEPGIFHNSVLIAKYWRFLTTLQRSLRDNSMQIRVLWAVIENPTRYEFLNEIDTTLEELSYQLDEMLRNSNASNQFTFLNEIRDTITEIVRQLSESFREYDIDSEQVRRLHVFHDDIIHMKIDIEGVITEINYRIQRELIQYNNLENVQRPNNKKKCQQRPRKAVSAN